MIYIQPLYYRGLKVTAVVCHCCFVFISQVIYFRITPWNLLLLLLNSSFPSFLLFLFLLFVLHLHLFLLLRFLLLHLLLLENYVNDVNDVTPRGIILYL